jgi:hypothetical protein
LDCDQEREFHQGLDVAEGRDFLPAPAQVFYGALQAWSSFFNEPRKYFFENNMQ